MRRQRDVVATLTDKELVFQVYLSQAMMLVLASICGLFLFESWAAFWALIEFDLQSILVIGGGAALAVVILDIILDRFLPERWLDDGGINERVFRGLTLPRLIGLCLVVSIVEELLFRAVLQTAFGLVIASTIFAVIHFRYLDKPILFLNVWLVSFFLGTIFLWTGNILVTIAAHFLIDFILGLIVRRQYLKKIKSSTERIEGREDNV